MRRHVDEQALAISGFRGEVVSIELLGLNVTSLSTLIDEHQGPSSTWRERRLTFLLPSVQRLQRQPESVAECVYLQELGEAESAR